MAKDKISDYSSTANSNTDIAGINIDEGCAPSGINDAIRTLMAQLKTWQSGGQDVYIHPAGSASAPSITANGDTNTGIFFPAADTVGITTGGTERARVDSAGNMGLGVTPSAWDSTFKSQEIGAVGNSFAGQSGASQAVLSSNAYYNGGWKYARSTLASQFALAGGQSIWYTAASGTAGNAITFTQAMTLDNSGNLGVGTTTTANSRLSVVGDTGSAAAGGLVVRGKTVDYQGISLFYAENGASSSAARAWQLAPNYTANGNLEFRVSASSTTNPSSTVMTLDSSGNLLVGTTSSGFFHIIKRAVSTDGSTVLQITHDGAGPAANIYAVASTATPNSANCGFSVGRAATSRSINAAGTVNASGADYAEYMTKAGDFTVAKGDVVGIDAEGKLTNVFANAISFAVKSTDPSYVGGDVWGTPEALGLSKLANDATQEEKDIFAAALEAARQTVDRIAFAGQVPVNVTGATAGQYIVPVNDNGAIKGEAVSNPTFEQYQQSVGKVIAIEQDGRARIIVKVA